MRKIFPILVAVVLVVLLVRSGVFKRGDSSVTPSLRNNGTVSTPTSGTTAPDAAGKSDTADPSGLVRPSDAAVGAVMDEMIAAWDKFDSAFAEIAMTIPHAVGHKGKTVGKGKYWIQKNDGPLRIYFEMQNEYRIQQEDKSMLVTGEELLTIIDGKHTYTLLNQPNNRTARKLKLTYADVLHLGGPHLWRDLVANSKLTLLPEEMRGSFATKVIKAEPKDGSRTTLNYFDKASGLRVELIELDETGQTSLEIKLTDVVLNPAMSSEQFKFVLPPQYQLEDLSQAP